ncbi:hypothetical protein [Mesorhizobium sp. WSM3626]|uniref:hypothetical protein n=1 Tax=Mesorhizobium sp. WSM3626 TaxID=1040987 RepID=UPI0018DC02DF|nr:hypothetical protein [Mesorhizobium sp. WSM3626]
MPSNALIKLIENLCIACRQSEQVPRVRQPMKPSPANSTPERFLEFFWFISELCLRLRARFAPRKNGTLGHRGVLGSLSKGSALIASGAATFA